MIYQRLQTMTAMRGFGILATVALLLTGWLGAAALVSAQESIMLTIAAKSCDGSGTSGSCWSEIGAQFTVTTQEGDFLGSCTLEGHRDAPYIVACGVYVPDGITVVVTEDVNTITPGYVPEENPIVFDMSNKPVPPNVPSFWGPIFHNGPRSGSARTAQTSDVAIAPTENGQPVTDACFVLVDYSNEGCDENGDGLVTFQDIPLGTYNVRQTADLGPGRVIPDFTIDVTGNMGLNGYEVFSTSISGGAVVQSSNGPVDISLITRDPDGTLLRDACYILVDYSNEGCDENGDGQVTFADVPVGTYTVRQTRIPAGYTQIREFDINVESAQGLGVPLGFIVKQAQAQNLPDTRNVSVILIDAATNTKTPMDACVQIVDASNIGCDEDLIDGQIDFLDVPAGLHDIVVSSLPAGYVATKPGDLRMDIDALNDPTDLFVYLFVSRENGSSMTDSPAVSFDAFVGTWGRHTAHVEIRADGTGELQLGSGCCTGVIYSLEFDVEVSPLTATIVDRSFYGEMDPARSALPGDTITFGFEPGENGDLLVVNMPDSEQRFIQRLEFCAPDGYDQRCGA